LIKDSFFLIEQSKLVVMHICPLFHKQQFPLTVFILGSSSQCVAWNEHIRPRRSGSGVTFFGKVSMNPDNIDRSAVENAIREILDTTHFLGSGNTTTYNSDVGVVETSGELEVVRDVAEPGFAGWDGPDAVEWLVLEIDTLLELAAV
jgi:hypothetical protein